MKKTLRVFKVLIIISIICAVSILIISEINKERDPEIIEINNELKDLHKLEYERITTHFIVDKESKILLIKFKNLSIENMGIAKKYIDNVLESSESPLHNYRIELLWMRNTHNHVFEGVSITINFNKKVSAIFYDGQNYAEGSDEYFFYSAENLDLDELYNNFPTLDELYIKRPILAEDLAKLKRFENLKEFSSTDTKSATQLELARLLPNCHIINDDMQNSWLASNFWNLLVYLRLFEPNNINPYATGG